MTKTTKRDRLLAFLQRHGWITQQQAIREGGYRYGARLYQLRREGWRIETKCLGDGEWLYRLRGKA